MKRLHVRIPDPVAAELAKRAARTGRTPSEIAREALQAGLQGTQVDPRSLGYRESWDRAQADFSKGLMIALRKYQKP